MMAPDGNRWQLMALGGAKLDGAKPDGTKPDGAKPDGTKRDGARLRLMALDGD